jgi:hypothetical protein
MWLDAKEKARPHVIQKTARIQVEYFLQSRFFLLAHIVSYFYVEDFAEIIFCVEKMNRAHHVVLETPKRNFETIPGTNCR